MFQFCTTKTIIAHFCHLIFAFAKKIRLTVDGDILQKNTTQMNHSVENFIDEKNLYIENSIYKKLYCEQHKYLYFFSQNNRKC